MLTLARAMKAVPSAFAAWQRLIGGGVRSPRAQAGLEGVAW